MARKIHIPTLKASDDRDAQRAICLFAFDQGEVDLVDIAAHLNVMNDRASALVSALIKRDLLDFRIVQRGYMVYSVRAASHGEAVARVDAVLASVKPTRSKRKVK